MTTASGFQMKLVDVFFLEDMTVFVGQLETAANFLGPARCRLVVDGAERTQIRIEGENLFRRDLQSVWTRERPKLSRDEIVNGEAWLFSI